MMTPAERAEEFTKRIEVLFALADNNLIPQLMDILKQKGARDNAFACPIARYLRPTEYSIVSVTTDEITLYAGPDCLPLVIKPTIVPVQEFILQFDNGEYPNLIDNEF